MNLISRQGRRRNPLDWMYFMDGPKRVCVQDAALYNNIAVQERERGPHRLAGHVIALACATRRRGTHASSAVALLYRARLKVGPRLRDCSRQVEAEVASNSSDKVHQTWGPPLSRAPLPASLITLLTIGEMDFYPNSRRKLDLQKVHLTFDHQVHSSCR